MKDALAPILLTFLTGLLACDDPQGLAAGKLLVLRGDRPSAQFGASGDFLGDVNDDGFADLAVGAPRDARNGVDAGAVFLYLGSADGPSTTPDAIFLGTTGEHFGTWVKGLGDLDADGFEELGVSGQGTVSIFFGSSAAFLRAADQEKGVRFSETADLRITDDVSYDGIPVLSSGADIDQNGGLDLALGLPESGQVRLFLSGGVFPNATRIFFSQADVVLTGNASEKFGASVSAAADVNGENQGLASRFGDDLLVGAPAATSEKGAAFVILGRGNLPHGNIAVADVATRLAGPKASSRFGTAVSGLGDFDGDGYGDVAIGAPEEGQGEVFVYFGESVRGPQDFSPLTVRGETEGDRFGAALSGALPLGVMGKSSLVSGAPFFPFGAGKGGSVYRMTRAFGAQGSDLHGLLVSATSSDNFFRSPISGSDEGSLFGSFVAAGHDVNGDGSGDLLAGAPGAASAGEDSGAVVVLW